MIADRLRWRPGESSLADADPRGTPGLSAATLAVAGKEWSGRELARLGRELSDQQARLAASARVGDRRRVLVVLQAMDCGGKDGVIRRVVGAMNPLGVRIVAFGPPSDEERAHEFLWRVRPAVPGPGQVGLFNRSHYEDVLVARVRRLVDEPVWRARFDAINDFEAELVDDGVTLVKIMLHISRDEQRRRLLARLDDPTKQWKFDPGDVADRALWSDFQDAYADVFNHCSRAAPWHVVPADRKWYRDWAVASLLAEVLAGMGLRFPEPAFDVEEQRRRLLAD